MRRECPPPPPPPPAPGSSVTAVAWVRAEQPGLPSPAPSPPPSPPPAPGEELACVMPSLCGHSSMQTSLGPHGRHRCASPRSLVGSVGGTAGHLAQPGAGAASRKRRCQPARPSRRQVAGHRGRGSAARPWGSLSLSLSGRGLTLGQSTPIPSLLPRQGLGLAGPQFPHSVSCEPGSGVWRAPDPQEADFSWEGARRSPMPSPASS